MYLKSLHPTRQSAFDSAMCGKKAFWGVMLKSSLNRVYIHCIGIVRLGFVSRG